MYFLCFADKYKQIFDLFTKLFIKHGNKFKSNKSEKKYKWRIEI